MNAILSITGSVKGVDPQGFALVGGIAFAIAPSQLPKKGQIVKIEAHLSQAPAATDDQPIWTATSVIAFDMPQAQPAAPVEVPQRTDHHNTISTPAAAPAAPAAAAPQSQRSQAAQPKAASAPVATSRFSTAPAKPKAVQTPAPSAASIAQKAVSTAATTSRFGKTAAAAAPAARPAAQPTAARPPFQSEARHLEEISDDDIPF